MNSTTLTDRQRAILEQMRSIAATEPADAPAWIPEDRIRARVPANARGDVPRTIRTLTRRGLIVSRGLWAAEREHRLTLAGFTLITAGGADRAAR